MGEGVPAGFADALMPPPTTWSGSKRLTQLAIFHILSNQGQMLRSVGSWFYRHQGMKLPRYEDLVHLARRLDVISAGELWMFRCHQPSSSSETRLWMPGRPFLNSASTNRVPVSLR